MRARLLAVALLAFVAATAVPAARQTVSAVDLMLPSDAAGDFGLAIRVYIPQTPRYVDGAPIAIFVAGGGGADAFTIRDQPSGVITIAFAFPGGTLDGRTSGGVPDQRGPIALAALAHVVQFALGQRAASDGRRIGDLASFPALTANVGVIGWSRGGDATINALARYPDETRGTRWIVTHESPAFANAIVGEIVQRPGATTTPADYVAGTCALLACQVLYPGIRWDANSRTGGTLYLDRNGNGRNDSATEPAISASLLTGTTRRVFTPSATAAAIAAGAFGSQYPSTIATLEESQNFWDARDVRASISRLIAAHPTLAAILHATEQDHVQSAADHPHVALVYNALQLGGFRWVRINPDAAYTAATAATLPDNDANAALPSNYSTWLVPEVSAADTRIVNAAIHELADRTRANRWDVNLASVIP